MAKKNELTPEELEKQTAEFLAAADPNFKEEEPPAKPAKKAGKKKAADTEETAAPVLMTDE